MRQRTRLEERLPPGSDVISDLDETIDEVDYRPIGGRGRRYGGKRPSERTIKDYQRWLRYYQDWCLEHGYQREVQFLSDRLAKEWTMWLTTEHPATETREWQRRWPPNSVRSALTALAYWSRVHALEPMPSLWEAWGVVHRYEERLEGEKIIAKDGSRRVLSVREVG